MSEPAWNASVGDGVASGVPTADVRPLDLGDLGPGSPPGPARDLRLLADIPVEVSVEVGRSRVAMRDLLALAPGSVLELDRGTESAVDVLVNGKLVARGELVDVAGECGVRVTEILGGS